MELIIWLGISLLGLLLFSKRKKEIHFSRNKRSDQCIQGNKPCEGIAKRYYQALRTMEWSSYAKLDKYQKLLYFTIKDIEDKKVLDYILSQIVNNNDARITDVNIKAKVKSFGLLLGEIQGSGNWYLHI